VAVVGVAVGIGVGVDVTVGVGVEVATRLPVGDGVGLTPMAKVGVGGSGLGVGVRVTITEGVGLSSAVVTLGVCVGEFVGETSIVGLRVTTESVACIARFTSLVSTICISLTVKAKFVLALASVVEDPMEKDPNSISPVGSGSPGETPATKMTFPVEFAWAILVFAITFLNWSESVIS